MERDRGERHVAGPVVIREQFQPPVGPLADGVVADREQEAEQEVRGEQADGDEGDVPERSTADTRGMLRRAVGGRLPKRMALARRPWLSGHGRCASGSRAATDGGSVRWLEAGSGWPLVLLHAFPLDADMWRPQLEGGP